MQIKVKPMGQYQTNCYILTIEGKDYIIDPGMNATEWVVKNCKNPVAILNTHGHFDHVWSNKELSEKLNIPIYCPKDDAFMLSKDPFKYGVPPSKASVLIKLNQKIEIENTTFTFWHFPGHTPGCSVIEYNDIWFSGDFLFEGSIGDKCCQKLISHLLPLAGLDLRAKKNRLRRLSFETVKEPLLLD